MPDPRALQILFDTYWGPKGWKHDSFAAPPVPAPSEFAYAKRRGLMFDHRPFPRAQILRWCARSTRRVTAPAAADAFVASLTTRRLDLRSALGSYAVARHLPIHDCIKHDDDEGSCGICGRYNLPDSDPEDLNVLNFERHKWGGVRHHDPLYIALDLDLFAKSKPPAATAEDRASLVGILNIADSLPARATPNDLARALKNAFPSTDAERRTVIAILALAGILQPSKHPSYRSAHIAAGDVPFPPGARGDWPYPAAWWKGIDRTKPAAVREWFPFVKRTRGQWR